MAYLGNLKGPRESVILDELGPGYFRVSPAQLEEDINYHQFAESRSEVVPVHVDEIGRGYIKFSTPDGPIRFYLEGKYNLEGDIDTFTPEEKLRWLSKNRSMD